MVEKLQELIEQFEIKIKATDRQFDEELLQLDPNEMKNFRPSRTSILFGYKECYEEVVKELKKLVQESERDEN